MSRTSAADRTEAFEAAFDEAPRAELPATIQQQVIDERPRGAISVHVKRDELEVLRKIKIIASAAGDDFFYSWSTKNRDGTKGVVEGPSIKCANAVSRIFGNCTVKVRVFDMGANWVFYAQFYDLETGYVLERPFQQRKGQKTGMGDADRQLDIVFQIGVSKAARNVVCNALSEFTDYAFAVAKEQLVEKVGRKLDYYRDQVRERLAGLKVEIGRVEAQRGKVLANWLAPDVAKVIAEIQSVNDGMAHPDELWPATGAEAGAPKPQPEDFQPAADGPATGKTAGQAAAAAAGPETPAAAAAEAPKEEPAQAAAPGAQAAVSPNAAQDPQESQAKPAADLPSSAQEPAQAGQEAAQDPADGPGQQPLGADEIAAQALERGEALLQRGIDNLLSLTTPEQIDQAQGSIVEILKEIEGLDGEDLALLQNKWKTAQLERKRDLGKRGKGGRR
jgi:hypothetical protein